MSETTDRAPWCPRCGGEMVHEMTKEGRTLFFRVGCVGCEFGSLQPSNVKEHAMGNARRLIRAELARQALEMRAHSAATQSKLHGGCLFTLTQTQEMAMLDYEALGAHPLRLPGEGA